MQLVDFATLACSLGLREALLEKYRETPHTHARGSLLIDGIFISEGVQIIQGGYTSFDDSPSDHRWLWVHISTQDLFGSSTDEGARPIERKVTSKMPSVRHRFNSALNDQLSEHNMHEKVLIFFKLCENQMKDFGNISDTSKATMDCFNNRIQHSIRFSDKHCRKARTSKAPFSTEAQRIMRAMRIQKLMLWRIELTGRMRRPWKWQLHHLAKCYNYKGNILSSNFFTVQAIIKQTSKEYSIFWPKAFEFWSTHLVRIAHELSMEDGVSVETHVCNVMQQEETKNRFRRIIQAEKCGYGGGVSAVERT